MGSGGARGGSVGGEGSGAAPGGGVGSGGAPRVGAVGPGRGGRGRGGRGGEGRGRGAHRGTSDPSKKRVQHSLEFKAKVVREYDAGSRACDVARKFGIRESTFRTIYKKKAEILRNMQAFGSSGDSSTRRKVAPRSVILTEKYLAAYINRKSRQNVPVGVSTIREQAIALHNVAARKCGADAAADFKASPGWLRRFLKRKGLHNLKFTGERASADVNAATEYPDRLAAIIEEEGYTPETVFNADETGLQWKVMARSTYVEREVKQAVGMKKEKVQVTLLLCVNAAGTCKLKPYTVGTAELPRAFNTRQQLKRSGVHWRKGGQRGGTGRASPWMTTALTLDWFDNVFVPAARKHCRDLGVPFRVLLLLDNAPVHPRSLIGRHRCVRVEFLPANTTSLLQPLDQEVIATFKCLYQRRVVQQLLRATDSGEETRLLEEEVATSGSSEEEEGDDEGNDSAADNSSDDDLPDPSSATSTASTPTASASASSSATATASASGTATASASGSTATATASASASSAAASPPENVTNGEVVALREFWRRYNIRHAVNNLVVAWNEVTVASIQHSWKRLTPQFSPPQTAEGEAAQVAATVAEEVAEIARTVPGSSGVTAAEVLDVAAVGTGSSGTLEAVMEDVDVAEREEEAAQEQLREGGEQAAAHNQLTVTRLATLLGHLDTVKEHLSQYDSNQDRVMRATAAINQVVAIYSPLHREKCETSTQSLISRYFNRRREAAHVEENVSQEQLELEAADVEAMSSGESDYEADFPGF